VIPGPPPADFSGLWNLQLVVLQDECGHCPSGTHFSGGFTIDQVQDSVTASLSSVQLKTDGTGSASGSTMNITFSGAVFVNDWYFVDSPGTASCSLSGNTINGAFFFNLGRLGECCGLCCQKGQCLCGMKDCRVPLPNCKMTLTFSGSR